MTPKEHGVRKPSMETGLSALLAIVLRGKGSGAPRRALFATALTSALAVLAVSYVSATPALAAAPETPEAKPVTAVTAKTATLNGVLNPGGKSEGGSFQFSYAPTAEPLDLECAGGGLAPLSPALSVGAAKEAVSAPATELQPNHEYAVCVTAFSLLAEPSARSEAVSFTTLPFKPEVASETASGVSGVAATLEAQVNPNNENTEYIFEYSTKEKAGKLEAPIVKVAGAAPLEGFPAQTASVPTGVLLPGTTYFYRVVAENAQSKKEGKAVASPVQSFTTLSTPKTEPVTAITATTATLNGTLTPFNASGEPKYSFDYNQGAEDCQGANATTATEPTSGTVSAEVTGLQPGTTYSVCLVSSNAFGSEVDPATPQVSFTTLAGPPSIESETASGVTPEGATLEAQVNPNNQASTCSFEYSTDPSLSTGVTTVPCSQPLGAGGSPATGAATVTGLQLKTTYYYRAVAENAAHETTTDPTIEHFETETAAAPTVESLEATNITASTADLDATSNPNNAATVYHIEYDTTAYEEGKPGHGTTVAGKEALTGTAAVKVSLALTGLKPNVEYHWRLLAESAAGTTTSSDQTFVDDTQPATPPGSCKGQEQVRQEDRSAALPDCRAYEMVTPPQKNGALIGSLFAGGLAIPQIAGNGTDIIAPSLQCVAGTESCTGIREQEGEPYEFARTSTGWVTRPLAPSAASYGITTSWAFGAEDHTTLFSAPNATESRDNFYVRTGDGPPAEIGPVSENGAPLLDIGGPPVEATGDFSHMLFATGGGLWSLDGALESQHSIYEYAGRSNTRPLSVGVEGGYGSTTRVSECPTFFGGLKDNRPSRGFGSLSEDGQVAFFTAIGHNEACPAEFRAPAGNELLERVDNETPGIAHTVLVSAATPASCTSATCLAAQSEPARPEFEGASNDGSRVFFTSTSQLSNHASQDESNLYESVCAEPCGTPAEEPVAKDRELVDVSEAEGEKAAVGGPRVQGVMAISADGSHVYFVASGVLAGNQGAMGSLAQDGQDNLYVYERDEAHPGGLLRFIATLPESDEQLFVGGTRREWDGGIGLANVTPDGRFLVFESHAALTADDTRVVGGPTQIYRYDAQTGEIVRVSVGEDGFNDDGNAGSTSQEDEPSIVPASFGWFMAVGPARSDLTMSDDGQYVFFDSPVGLTPGALNEVKVNNPPPGQIYAENVYEYHDGNVSLISDGKDTTPNSSAAGINTSTRLLGASESGHDVFFATNSQLTSEDTDTDRDYYDAHICEESSPCAPPPPSPGPGCSEEACRGQAPGTPLSTSPASESFTGPGNLTAPPPPVVVKPKPLTRAQKLARALKACRAKRDRHRRAVCEKAARHEFGTVAKAKRSAHPTGPAGR